MEASGRPGIGPKWPFRAPSQGRCVLAGGSCVIWRSSRVGRRTRAPPRTKAQAPSGAYDGMSLKLNA